MGADWLLISRVYKFSLITSFTLFFFQHLLNFGYVKGPVSRFRDAKTRQGPFSSGGEKKIIEVLSNEILC